MQTHLDKTACWMSINRACNLRCKWCYAKNTKYKSEDTMPLKLAFKCIDLAVACGVKTIVLLGGEPLLHPDVCKIIDYAHEALMSVVISSNGLLLGESTQHIKVLARLNETDELALSIKGFSNHHYLINCNVSSGFDLLKKAITNIRKSRVNYSLSYVITEQIPDSLQKELKLLCNQFASPVGLSISSPCFLEECSNRMPKPKKAALITMQVLSELANETSVSSIHVNAPLCLLDQQCIHMAMRHSNVIVGCNVLNNSGIVFDTFGNLLLCNHLYDLPVGMMGEDYDQVDNFLSFLKSDKYLRAWSAFTKLPYEKCSSCSSLAICKGGCPLLFY